MNERILVVPRAIDSFTSSAHRISAIKNRIDVPPQDKFAYAQNTNNEVLQLIERYARTGRVIPVSFRKLVPWLKVGERATHYIHPYPAKLLPHIAHFFLSCDELCPKSGIVLDPFGGSGTVALEASLSGRVPAYADTNPLAQLIARTKTWAPAATNFDSILDDVRKRFRKSRSSIPPNVVNITKWFDAPVIKALTRLRVAIFAEQDEKIRDFLLTTFSATVRRASNADLRLSVPVLKKNSERQLKSEDVWVLFVDQYVANVRRMHELHKIAPQMPNMIIAGPDARKISEASGGVLKDNSIDLVITSPPYAGAQKYIRASSLSLGWLGLAGEGQLKPLENITIGREHLSKNDVSEEQRTSVPAANRVIARIEKVNKIRAAICTKYLNEMEEVIKQLGRVVRIGGHFVLVIGNNEVCGEKFLSSEYLHTQILREGFRLKLKLVDEIKSRGLMTKRNRSASIITREWVLLFEKVTKPC
jgi:16S rRNA G966 N2-methylase RsmD